MRRITKKMVDIRVCRLHKENYDVGMDTAYGQVRITNESGSANYCSLGTPKEAMNFLEGFEIGLKVYREKLLAILPVV